MYPEICCKCHQKYTPLVGGSISFCPDCVIALKTFAADAEKHVAAINSGSTTEVPETDAEAATVRRVIRDRMNSQPDTEYGFTTRRKQDAKNIQSNRPRITKA